MTATTNVHKAETINCTATRFDHEARANTVQAKGRQAGAAARRRGLTVKEVAALMGVNYGHLCSVANGRRPWTPMLRERATAVLGEAPGQGVVYRRGGLVQGESTGIRERARALGLSMGELADLVGVSRSYMTLAARGHRNMSPRCSGRWRKRCRPRPGSNQPRLPRWTRGRCGTAWRPMVSPRTRRPGGPASAPPCSPRS